MLTWITLFDKLILITRAWDSLSAVTCCRSLVVVYDSNCVLQIGVAAESPLEDGDAMDVDVKKLLQGSLCKSAMESQKRMSFASICSWEKTSSCVCVALLR